MIKYFTTVDKVPAEDKIKHAIIGWRYTEVSFLLTACAVYIFNLNPYWLLAFIIPTIAAGVAKEIKDKIQKTGTPEFLDFWATIKKSLILFIIILITIKITNL